MIAARTKALHLHVLLHQLHPQPQRLWEGAHQGTQLPRLPNAQARQKVERGGHLCGAGRLLHALLQAGEGKRAAW